MLVIPLATKRLSAVELPKSSETVLCRYRCIPRFCVRLRSCFWYCSGPYSTSRSRSFFPSCIHAFGVVPGISSLAMFQRSLAYFFRSSIDRALRKAFSMEAMCAVVKVRIIVVHRLTIASMAAAASGQREKNLFLQRSALASAAFSHRSARCLSCWRPYTLLSYRLLTEFKAS